MKKIGSAHAGPRTQVIHGRVEDSATREELKGGRHARDTGHAAAEETPTRERVAYAILNTGPSTAAELAERMNLTPAAVRRHLDQLIADGIIAARDQRMSGPRGRGRPAKEFCITEAGRDHFAHSYDELAVDALRFLAGTGGDAAVTAFAEHRLKAMEERYRDILASVDGDQRPQKLAEALSADGYAASVTDGPPGTGNSVQICQHHCPVAHVAEEFTHLCEAETDMIARLLDTHVQRLATIAHKDGVCTTYLPDKSAEPKTTTVERLSS